MNEAMARDKREKWTRHIARIQQQVIRLMNNRRWHRVFVEIVNANPKLRPGIPVLDSFRDVYGDYFVLAVRRQAKPNDDSISLLALIEEIAAHPEPLTLEWTIARYSEPLPNGHVYDPEMARNLAEKTFKTYADATGRIFDGTIAARDAKRLRDASEHIVSHADTRVAHDDKRLGRKSDDGAQKLVTYDDLDAAVDVIADLTKKYLLVLTGASFRTMTPFDLTNATSVFTFPWIDPQHPPDLSGRDG